VAGRKSLGGGQKTLVKGGGEKWRKSRKKLAECLSDEKSRLTRGRRLFRRALPRTFSLWPWTHKFTVSYLDAGASEQLENQTDEVHNGKLNIFQFGHYLRTKDRGIPGRVIPAYKRPDCHERPLDIGKRKDGCAGMQGWVGVGGKGRGKNMNWRERLD